MRADETGEQIDAFLAIEVDDVDAVFAEPVDTTLEGAAFADDQCADAELADEAAAVPAGCESGDHDQVAVGGLAAGAAEGVGFAVDGGVAVLNAAVVPTTDEFAILSEERCADRNSAFS